MYVATIADASKVKPDLIALNKISEYLQPATIFVNDNQELCVSFELVEEAKLWVIMIRALFSKGRELVLGLPQDSLCLKFNDFRMPLILYEFLLCIADGESYINDGQWCHTKNPEWCTEILAKLLPSDHVSPL